MQEVLYFAVPNIPRTYRRYRRLTEQDWTGAIRLFERGEFHAIKLAEIYGVCEKTMRSGLKARGAVKACRINEVRPEIYAMIVECQRLAKIKADANIREFAKLLEKYPGEAFEELDLSEWENRDPMEGADDLDLSF